MSGIVGILNLDGAPINRSQLELMTSFMSFRGPDAQDVWINGSIGFGHTLLRTTYESGNEREPCSLDGQVWITADARLDARAELVESLRARGRDVGSTTNDPELILHAYGVWENKCVEHLIGDFAFAIWDARKQALFCARDQFGVVPFFYAQPGRSFLCSNTLACLRLDPRLTDRLNEQAVGDFLLFRTNHDPTTTTFSDIRRLPPAHTLTVRNGEVSCARYWSLAEQVVIENRAPAEIVAQFRMHLDRSVRDRLRTPSVAVPMSGGMDSSSIAVTAQRLLKADASHSASSTRQDRGVRAYTMTVDHLMQDDERDYAGLVAAHAGIPIQYLDHSSDHSPEVRTRIAPEPGILGPLNSYPIIAQDAVQFTRVLLSGLGGDPLFYPSQTFFIDQLRTGHFGMLSRAVTQQFQLGQRSPLYLKSWLKRRFKPPALPPLPDWLEPSFATRLDLTARFHDVISANAAQDSRRGMAENPYWSNSFARADPGATGFPIKSRHPYFDLRLLNFVLSVPPVPWFVNKTLLREAMRGALPEPVRLRPKTPLAENPLQVQARRQPIAWMQDLATTDALVPFVNRDNLLRLVNSPGQATPQEYLTLYAPLALADWMRGQAAIS